MQLWKCLQGVHSNRFIKVTANKKKCTSDPAKGEVLKPSEVTPANADEDATFKIYSSEALVSQSSTPPLTCNEVCCVSPQEKPFQPSTKGFNAKSKSRTFQETWYSNFPWITVSTTCTKAFCYTCREANKQGLLSFSKYADVKFTTSGFDNWKKSLEKFRKHKASEAHRSSTEIVLQEEEGPGSRCHDFISTRNPTSYSFPFLCFYPCCSCLLSFISGGIDYNAIATITLCLYTQFC